VIPAIFCLLSLIAQDPLTAILSRMDKNAKTFKSAAANVKYTSHNAAVDVNTDSSGTIAIKGSSTSDMRALIRITDPAASARQISVGKGVADIYTPRLQLIDEYKIAGKYNALFQQFYLLGFGGSGKDLANAYTITFIGSETIGDVKASHLQMIPKSPDVAKEFTKVEMWLSEATGYPAQLRFITPAGDSTTVLYTNVRVNPSLSKSDLELKTPSGVKKREMA
jgi:outer membrane lipoprotein-sorting protein